MSSPWEIQRLPSATERRNARRRQLAAERRAEAIAQRQRRQHMDPGVLRATDAHALEMEILGGRVARTCENPWGIT